MEEINLKKKTLKYGSQLWHDSKSAAILELPLGELWATFFLHI